VTSSLSARRLAGTLAYIALAALAVVAVALLPLTDYMMHILVQTASYAIAVFGLTVVLGLCGQINLAQAAFFGFGAYAVGKVMHGVLYNVAVFDFEAFGAVARVTQRLGAEARLDAVIRAGLQELAR